MSITDEQFNDRLNIEIDKIKKAILGDKLNPITVQAIFIITKNITEYLIDRDLFNAEDYNRLVALDHILDDFCNIHERIVKETTTFSGGHHHKLTKPQIKSIREQFKNGDTAIIKIHGKEHILTMNDILLSREDVKRLAENGTFEKINKEIKNANNQP